MQAGDTILLAPGNYDQGGKVYSNTKNKVTQSLTNRLAVTKQLIFEAIGSAAETRIVGKHSSDASGFGYDAIRCVLCEESAVGTIFRKITFADGGTANDNAYDDVLKSGGGFYPKDLGLSFNATANIFKFYLDQCVFTNCTALFGGAQYGGTSIRCHFVDNIGSAFGQAVCGGAAWNCLIEHTYANRNDRPIFGNYARAVNCTVFDTYTGRGAQHGAKVYNTIICGPSNPFGGYVDGSFVEEFKNCYSNVKDDDGAGYDERILLSPGSGDYRILKGTCAEDGALVAYVKSYSEGGEIVLPTWVEMKDFAGNTIDTTKDTIDAGCLQGAATPQTGVVEVPDKSEIDGHLNIKATYVRTSEWPKQFHIVPHTSDTFFRYYYKTTVSGETSTYRYLDWNGGVYIIPPKSVTAKRTLQAETATKEVWVDPKNGVAATGTGTKAAPYRTLQAAMDAIESLEGGKVLVHALPGEYDEGYAILPGDVHTNRVVMPDKVHILIKSTKGAAETIIRGKADVRTNCNFPDNYRGCGPGAIRCVYSKAVDYYQALQGFTFADGCSDATDYKTTPLSDQVGGVGSYGGYTHSFQVLDSVFTNCCAVRMGAMYNGQLIRCRLDDCVSYGGVVRSTHFNMCDVLNTCTVGTPPSGASANYVCGTSSRMYFTTFAPTGDSYVGNNYADISGSKVNTLYGCLFGPNVICKSARLYGSVWQTGTKYNNRTDPTALGQAETELGLVNWNAGDWRMYTFTQAMKDAVLPEEGTAEWTAYEDKLVAFVGSGIDGVPLTVVNGKPLPGAHQGLVSGAYFVENAASAFTIEGANAGCNVIADKTSDTISLSPLDKNVCGVMVQGVTNQIVNGAAVECTVANLEGAYITPVYTTEWFVDAKAADDSADGFTAARAKKTLKGALQHANRAGQVVHVAAGTYDEGEMRDADDAVASRALVRAGVTLEGAGRDNTFIVGSAATSDDKNAYGCGANAVRCVFMESGATIRGFTLKDGCTFAAPSFSDVTAAHRDYTGGGVRGTGGTSVRGETLGKENREAVLNTRVEDCLITNCFASCGGGAMGATLFNCKVLYCGATRGSLVERSGLWGTILDYGISDGSSGIGVNNTFVCVNATIGSNCSRKADEGKGTWYGIPLYRQWNYDFGMTNTVVIGYMHGITQAVNCVFHAAYDNTLGGFVNCRNLTSTAQKWDANYVPCADSPLIDTGLEPLYYGVTNDVNGGQRVYNGAIDIGAAEYDWRGKYALDMGNRVVVDNAAPLVTESDGKVRLVDDTTLTAHLKNAPNKAVHMKVSATISGTGTLQILVNGENVSSLTSAATSAKIQLTNPQTDKVTLAYAGDGYADISSILRDCGFVLILR